MSGEVGALVAKQKQELMAPPPPRPRKRKREELVLDEDEWLETLEAIIQRDYFPDLPKLENELEWLEAVRSKDPTIIRQAQANIASRRAGLKTPMGQTPATFATPATVAARTPGLDPSATPLFGAAGEEGTHLPAVASTAPKMSLDQFMSRHTSEDNASFKEILAGINKRRRERYAWARGSNNPAEVKLLEDSRPLDGYGSSGQPSGALLTWNEPPENALYYRRDAVPFSEKELAMQVQGPPKEISTSNTRMPGAHEEDVDLAPEAKRVRGDEYDRVATPAFTPGPEQPPPITWGSLEATPARVVEDDSGPRFHVPQRTSKDLLAHRLADGARLNLQKRAALMSPSAMHSLQRQTPRVRSRLHGTPAQTGAKVAMSPAAHRLASSLRGKHRSADTSLRASYSGTGLRRPRPVTGATPALAPGPGETPAIVHEGDGSPSQSRSESREPSTAEVRARQAAAKAFQPDVARSQALRAFQETSARREALKAFGKITDDLLQL